MNIVFQTIESDLVRKVWSHLSKKLTFAGETVALVTILTPALVRALGVDALRIGVAVVDPFQTLVIVCNKKYSH